MSNDELSIHADASCAFKYADMDSIHIQTESNTLFTPWRPGQALTEWWSQLNPSNIKNDQIDELIEGMEYIDGAETSRSYRRSIFLLHRDSQQWLAEKDNQQSILYPFIKALNKALRNRFESICLELLQKSKEAIDYADINITRYKHDIKALKNELKQLSPQALERDKTIIKKRIDKLKIPLTFLQKLKIDNEENIREINNVLA